MSDEHYCRWGYWPIPAKFRKPCDCKWEAQAKALAEALAELVKSNEDHNAAVSADMRTPVGWHGGYLNKAREALAAYRGGQTAETRSLTHPPLDERNQHIHPPENQSQLPEGGIIQP